MVDVLYCGGVSCKIMMLLEKQLALLEGLRYVMEILTFDPK